MRLGNKRQRLILGHAAKQPICVSQLSSLLLFPLLLVFSWTSHIKRPWMTWQPRPRSVPLLDPWRRESATRPPGVMAGQEYRAPHQFFFSCLIWFMCRLLLESCSHNGGFQTNSHHVQCVSKSFPKFQIAGVAILCEARIFACCNNSASGWISDWILSNPELH